MFLAGQVPMMQSVIGSYIEQGKSMFMQEQMQNQKWTMFGNAFPFPGPTPPSANPPSSSGEKSKK